MKQTIHGIGIYTPVHIRRRPDLWNITEPITYLTVWSQIEPDGPLTHVISKNPSMLQFSSTHTVLNCTMMKTKKQSRFWKCGIFWDSIGWIILLLRYVGNTTIYAYVILQFMQLSNPTKSSDAYGKHNYFDHNDHNIVISIRQWH